MNDTLRQWKRDTFWYVIWFITGAGVMIWINSHVVPVQTKPVVTVEQDGARAAKELGSANSPRPVALQQARDAAPPLAVIDLPHLERAAAQLRNDLEAWDRESIARATRFKQRNDELAFAARKLAGVKQTWDLKLGEVGK